MRRSPHNLSHQKLLSCDMGELIPCNLLEVMPGDTIQQSTNILLRASPLLAPVMHRVDVRLHHFFVPFRLLWEDWEEFITGGPGGTNNSTFPTVSTGGSGFALGSLADYLGVPPGVANQNISALPFRAYALIWNEYYRDQDLQTPLVIDLTDGADTTTSTALQNCGWEKDYFTSARPWEQKGPAVTIPLGSRANVRGIGLASGASMTVGSLAGVKDTTGTVTYDPSYRLSTGNSDIVIEGATAATGSLPDVWADLSSASAITVNLLREALALQRYEENRAQYGSRYVEYLRYLGVRSSDARLQRPEYLGGGRQSLQFSEVLQTAEGTDPVGELKGHGIAAMRSNRYRRYIEEHGYVLSLLSVRPKTVYANGLFRTWNRREKEDFWQKEFEHIGQQEVLNKEVYFAHGTPDGTFGFQDRYDEYRRMESSIAGEFRTTLDFWHMARIFSSPPALNASFISAVPTERIFAVPSADVLWVNAMHRIQSRRLVSSVGKSFIF